MLKLKIKISQVSNLTDARYFAAMGVDFLGFNIHPEMSTFIPPSTLKEIVEWVEGPSIVLETYHGVDGPMLEDYTQYLKDYYLEGKPGNDNLDFLLIDKMEDLSKNGEEFIIFISSADWTSLKKDLTDLHPSILNRLFLDIPFHLKDLPEIMSSGVLGMVLRGGEEEKIGVKSYDYLDEIFELLAD